jgi:hypothetical protein
MCGGKVAQRRTWLRCPPFHQAHRFGAICIISNDDLVGSRVEVLRNQACQAPVEQMRAPVRRHDDGSAERHNDYFLGV